MSSHLTAPSVVCQRRWDRIVKRQMKEHIY